MKSIYKIAFFITTLAVIIISLIPMLLNNQVVVSKTILLDASQEAIFDEIIEFKKYTTWNDRFKRGSLQSVVYFSPYKGVGSSVKWEAISEINNKGESRIDTIKNNNFIVFSTFTNENPYPILEYFVLEKQSENQTKITWQTRFPATSYFGRYVNFFNSIDIENYLEKSLNNLQLKLAQYQNKTSNQKNKEYQFEYLPQRKILSYRFNSPSERAELYKNLVKNYKLYESILSKKLKIKNIDSLGKLWIYYEKNENPALVTLNIGHLTKKNSIDLPELKLIDAPSGKILKKKFVGKIFDTERLQNKILDYGLTNDLELYGRWEEYNSTMKKPDSISINIYFQIKN